MALTARKVLSWFFLLKRKLSSIPSMTGSQLERIKNNYNLSMGHRVKVVEDLQIALADVGTLLKEVTKEELEVCELRYGQRAGKIEKYRRVVKKDEVKRKRFVDELDELLTEDGESVVGPAYTLDGSRLEGYVEVEGWKTRCLTYHEIALALGKPFRIVRYMDRSACEKIRSAIRKRQKEALVHAEDLLQRKISLRVTFPSEQTEHESAKKLHLRGYVE